MGPKNLDFERPGARNLSLFVQLHFDVRGDKSEKDHDEAYCRGIEIVVVGHGDCAFVRSLVQAIFCFCRSKHVRPRASRYGYATPVLL